MFLSLGSSDYKSLTTNIEYVGLEFELSNYALVVYYAAWTSGRPIALSISEKTYGSDRSNLFCESDNDIQSIENMSGILRRGTYRCYCKRAAISTDFNRYMVYGHVFK